MIKLDKFCPLEYTSSLICGRWKLRIIWFLGMDGLHRYGELKKKINASSHKMLAQQLKELEADGVIIRKQYNEIPPRVEYYLSDKGLKLMPIVKAMQAWGNLFAPNHLRNIGVSDEKIN